MRSPYRAIPKRPRSSPVRPSDPYGGKPKSAPRETLQADGTVVVSHVGHDVQRPDILFSEEAKAPQATPLLPCRTVAIDGTDPA